MATSSALSASSEQTEVHRLKSGSLGLVGILLLAFSSAAPLVGCLGNIPLAVAFGNGVGAPAGFIVAMGVLLCFAVGMLQ